MFISKSSKEKPEFILKDHSFKLVSMRVFGHKEHNILNYTLLVVDEVIIYDFKVQIEKMTLTMETTASHKETKKNNESLFLRKDFFKILGLQHSFTKEGQLKTKQSIINQNKLDELNNFLWKFNWKNITFKNIEFLISGSNPSGEGNATSGFKTIFNATKFLFGFLFQKLNRTKSFQQKYGDNSRADSFFQKYWDDDFKNFPEGITLERCSFEDWISGEKMLQSFFRAYTDKDTHWKEVNEEIEQWLIPRINKLTNLDSIVHNKRREQKNKVIEVFQNYQNWSNEIFRNPKACIAVFTSFEASNFCLSFVLGLIGVSSKGATISSSNVLVAVL